MNEHFDLSKCNEQGLRNLRMMCWAMGWFPQNKEVDLQEVFKEYIRNTEFPASPEQWNEAEGFTYCYWNSGDQIYPTPPDYEFDDLVKQRMNSDAEDHFDFVVYDAQGRRRELHTHIEAYLEPPDERDDSFDAWLAKADERKAKADAKKAKAAKRRRAKEATKKAALAKLTAAERKALGL